PQFSRLQFPQMPQRQLGHLSRPDAHHHLVIKTIEHLPGEIHRDRPHRQPPVVDRRLAPHLLAHRQRLLKQPVQHRPHRPAPPPPPTPPPNFHTPAAPAPESAFRPAPSNPARCIRGTNAPPPRDPRDESGLSPASLYPPRLFPTKTREPDPAPRLRPLVRGR